MKAKLGFAFCAAALLVVCLPVAAETGAVAELVIPTESSQPVSIVTAPDRALWFTEFAGNKIGRLTFDGVFDEYPIPTARAQPDDIALGPEGNLWFAETSGNKIGRITTAGVIDEFDGPPAGSRPTAVAAGPDGNVWFTALEYQSDPQSTRLDLPLVPPRKHPTSANHTDRRPPTRPMSSFTPYQ